MRRWQKRLEESCELWKKAQWDGETGITEQGDIPWIWLVNIDHLYWAKSDLAVAQREAASSRSRLVDCK